MIQLNFLIVEQYLGNQWEKDKKSKAKLSMSISTSDLEFAGLIEKPIDGLEFYRRQSNTNSVSVDGKNPFGASLGYSRQIYRVTNETGKEIVLTKKFFENLPKKSRNSRTHNRNNQLATTMCIVHKGFRGFRGASPASNLGGNLIGKKPAFPYDTIHSPLCFMLKERQIVR